MAAANDLLPAAIKRDMPKFEDTIRTKDPMVRVKYSVGSSDWYALEGERDGTDFLFYGILTGKPALFGMFSLSELQKRKATLDKKFKPTPFSKLAAKQKWGDLKL